MVFHVHPYSASDGSDRRRADRDKKPDDAAAVPGHRGAAITLDQQKAAANARSHDMATVAPLSAIFAFFGLTAVAMARFPGGNRYHPEAHGFAFFDNFWCDLFDEKTYAGVLNDGRSYAIAASIVLFISMIPLWWELPKTFVNTARLMRPAQICGTLGMLAATLVPTALHDQAILVAGPLGGAAYQSLKARAGCLSAA